MVEKCKKASNTAPGKSIPNKAFIITRCPELLMGKNSDNPCTNPKKINAIYYS